MPEFRNTELSKIFDKGDSPQLGKTRDVHVVTGKEGVDFVVKEKRSPVELKILQFLSKSELSETLLTYDDKTLVISKINGVDLGTYLRNLVHSHPEVVKKLETFAQTPTANSKFKVTGAELSYLPETSIFEVGEVRNFYIDYISKMLALVLLGVFHKDTNTGNIMVSNGGKVKFIDFGDSLLAEGEHNTSYDVFWAYSEIDTKLQLLEKINPRLAELPFQSEAPGFSKAMERLYSGFKDNMPLSERPKVALSWLKGDGLETILRELNFPSEIVEELKAKIKTQVESLA